jgi:hypothetical protein
MPHFFVIRFIRPIRLWDYHINEYVHQLGLYGCEHPTHLHEHEDIAA